MEKIRSAVIGTGYLGTFHTQKYASLPSTQLVAVVDQSIGTARQIGEPLGIRCESDYRRLLGEVDAVSIVVPTQAHYQIARDFLLSGTHVLLEKPMTSTTEQAEELIQIAAQESRVLQIGHLERFNPAILAMENLIQEPKFIESHRLAPFQQRGTDVNVILDLMIHDIDLILSMVGSDIASIDAAGMDVLSNETDIANARIRFTNGCVANVTASRVSDRTERKLRVFQRDRYLSADLGNRNLKVYQFDHNSTKPTIHNTIQDFEKSDALLHEIDHFLQCIDSGQPPKVSGVDGLRALQTATTITKLLNQ